MRTIGEGKGEDRITLLLLTLIPLMFLILLLLILPFLPSTNYLLVVRWGFAPANYCYCCRLLLAVRGVPLITVYFCFLALCPNAVAVAPGNEYCWAMTVRLNHCNYSLRPQL